jgi:hypothetical protein
MWQPDAKTILEAMDKMCKGEHQLKFVEQRQSTVAKNYDIKISLCTLCGARYNEYIRNS